MGKRLIIELLIAILPVITIAQSAGKQVRRPAKKQQTTNTTPTKKRQNPKKENEQEFEKRQEQEPIEAASYDVTFICNVPSATLLIDGNSYGKPNKTILLKTGSHSVKLNAEGYKSLTQTIQVNSSSRSFSFTMKKNENKLPLVIQNLVNNMVRVEGGNFTMGATSKQGKSADRDEKTTHQVTLSSFSIGKYEVTQEEWQAVMGSNPSIFKGSKRPIENVSWNDCQEFVRKLNAMTGKRFRLPTEAEWEYAARGGNMSIVYTYAGSDNLDHVAWYDSNSGSSTHEVGQKSSNELGLYDMSGNVCEWCQDWKDGYNSNSQTNPTGPPSGFLRVCRGGGWNDYAGRCRVSFRLGSSPSVTVSYLGLRLAL